ncbi:conjugative transposon TraN protein, partial [Porphyromonas uenonis 60-3]
MKKWILSIVVCATITLPAMAQQVEGNNQLLSSGDLYQGMSRSIPNGRVVLPYGLEVTFEKTVHLIFPAAIRYVDLGSQNIIAGKADDAENVLRVKAAVREFETETNMSVICEDGSFYAFNVKYADEPEKLSMEMKDFLAPTEGRLPSNRADIYFKELGSESPILVKLIMKSIYQNDKRIIKHVGAKQFGMRFLLRGLYAHNGLLYFHVRMDNESNMPYAVDFITFKVVDKKVAKHTAIQER